MFNDAVVVVWVWVVD